MIHLTLIVGDMVITATRRDVDTKHRELGEIPLYNVRITNGTTGHTYSKTWTDEQMSAVGALLLDRHRPVDPKLYAIAQRAVDGTPLSI